MVRNSVVFQLLPVAPGPHEHRKIVLDSAVQGVGQSLLVEKPDAVSLVGRQKLVEHPLQPRATLVVDNQGNHSFLGVGHAHLLQPRRCDDLPRDAFRHSPKQIPQGEEHTPSG